MPGNNTVELTVTDDSGLSDATTISFHVCGSFSGLDSCALAKGDLIFVRNSKLVTFFGDTFYSHVGTYSGNGNVIDSTFPAGVSERPFEEFIGDTETWAVGRVAGIDTSQFLASIRNRLGAPYGTENLLEYGAETDIRDREDLGIYCSQLPWLAGQEQSVDLDGGTNPKYEFVTPTEVIDASAVHVVQQSGSRHPRATFIRAESPVDLLIIDSEGRRSGWDPVTGIALQEIPGAIYVGPTGLLGPENFSVLASDEVYTVIANGNGTGPFTIRVTDSDLGSSQHVSVSETAYPGSNHVYMITNADGGPSFQSSIQVVLGLTEIIHALPDSAFRQAWHRNLFLNRLSFIENQILLERWSGAEIRLQSLRNLVDGCDNAGGAPDSNDWVVDCGAQTALRNGIDAALGQIPN